MKLQYPFTFEEWLTHKSTIPKLKWIKKISEQIKNDSKQLKLRLWINTILIEIHSLQKKTIETLTEKKLWLEGFLDMLN